MSKTNQSLKLIALVASLNFSLVANYDDSSSRDANQMYNSRNNVNSAYGDTGSSNDTYGSNGRSNSYYSSQNVPSSNTGKYSDQELTKKIKDKIGGGWFSKGYDKVNVQVNSGSVTLGGSVDTAEDKEKVEREVRNIDGVRNVNSQITVQDARNTNTNYDRNTTQNYNDRSMDRSRQNSYNQQASSYDKNSNHARDKAATSTDEQLNKKIRDNVTDGWLWNSYKQVTLNTNNGTVTLEGTVRDMDDQQQLMKQIQGIDGVHNVRSNLTFSNR